MTTTEPDVSVVMATYNAQDFLARALASTTSQLGVTLEIVVVDDASTDSTAAVVAEHMAADPRIRLVRLERNAGPAAARNAGIAAARGRWVAILDADDAFLPGRLAHLLAVAEDAGVDMVADEFLHVDPRTNAVHAPGFLRRGPHRIDLHEYLRRARPDGIEPDIGLLKPMIRRSFLRRHELAYPEDARHGEDFLFMVHALMAGATLLVGAGCGYLYTLRSAGWSRTAVDYRAVARHSNALARSSALRADPVARRILVRRSRIVHDLEEMIGNVTTLRDGGIPASVRELASRPRPVTRGWLLYATSQLRRHVVRPAVLVRRRLA